MELYNNIKALRIQNGWSQEELAKRVGYNDRSSIAKIESGKVDLFFIFFTLFLQVHCIPGAGCRRYVANKKG